MAAQTQKRKNIRLLPVLLAIFGVAGATILVGWFGFGRIAEALASVGAGGFALYAAWQAALFVLLGVAWWAVAPPGPKLPVFVCGRMVRDAGSSCLPFSQIGGFVMGARAVTLFGVRPTVATISTVVDLTSEFVSEILFLVVGLVILLVHGKAVPGATPIAIGAAVALVAGVALTRLQRHVAPLFVRFGRRILGQWRVADAAAMGIGGAVSSEAELAAMYGRTGRIMAGTALHLIGWFGKGAGNWIGFRLLGAPIDMASALAIEALLHAVLAAAFLVPGYAGIQEIGYTGLGALFGATPELSLGVSLIRRARDLALGVPILLAWQIVELRRLGRPGAGA